MSLTRQQEEQVRVMRDKYKTAILQRTENDPSTFEANLGFIKMLEEVTKQMKAMIEPVMGRSDQNIIQLANAIQTSLNTGDVKRMLKEEFEKEPRIALCEANENESFRASRMFSEKTQQMTYTIKFSDGKKLEWHSMDKHVLNNIKEEFNQRMRELAPRKRSRFEPNAN